MQCRKQFTRGSRQERRVRTEIRVKAAEMLGHMLVNTYRVLMGNQLVAVVKVNAFNGEITIVSGQLSAAGIEQVKRLLDETEQ
jgi:hypothetical protein